MMGKRSSFEALQLCYHLARKVTDGSIEGENYNTPQRQRSQKKKNKGGAFHEKKKRTKEGGKEEPGDFTSTGHS